MTAVAATELPLRRIGRGKVRDIYDVDAERLLLVATDRVSAFDVVMREAIPHKGAVLTQISAWWFAQLGELVEHHMITAHVDAIVDAVPTLEAHRREIAPRIHVAADEEETQWRISVRDNGEGIDSKDFERVFQLFQRLCTEKERPGTGIGLSLCKRIVERHGGQISVESKKGEGSVFSFTLPKQSSSE